MKPEDFIITRKRKKYKFARFGEFINCYEVADWPDANPNPRKLPVTLELGAGTGLFAVELAKLHLDRFYIAVDVKADRLQAGSKLATKAGLSNIVFLRAHAEQLQELLNAQTITELWLTFSDPYPKKRHAKHRLTHPKYLQIYKNLLISSGLLRLKTDNQALFEYSLEQLAAEGWHIGERSFDLHQSSLPDEYKIMTTYEARFVASGLPIYYLSATIKK